MKRVLPLFLVILALALIIPVHATSQYVGYNASNIGTSTCGSNCGGPPTAQDWSGIILHSPINGQLDAISLFIGSSIPTKIMIATFYLGGQPPASENFACTGSDTCKGQLGGTVFTVRDVESVGGLAGNSFNTINLAAPVTTIVDQWVFVGINFSPTPAGLIFCSASCGNHAQASALGQVISADMIGVGASPAINSQFTSTHAYQSDFIVGGQFDSTTSANQPVSQCYGNCGSPVVTLANTNSTHSIPFNNSITIFYQAQSQLNGFVNNVTVSLAKSYSNSLTVTVALYTVDPTCSGIHPAFSLFCPAFLSSQQSSINPGKGKFTMTTATPIQIGQWFGIAVTSNFAPIDLNDTNTNVNLWQTNGNPPGFFTSETSLGNSKLALYSFVTGNFIITGPPVGGGGGGGSGGICSTPQCGVTQFAALLGSNSTFAGIIAWLILSGTFSFMLFFLSRKNPAAFPILGVLSLVVSIVLLVAFSVINILPGWIPLAIIAIVSLGVAFGFWSFGLSSRRQAPI